MTHVKIFLERSGKTGADEILKSLAAEKHFHPFAAGLFPDPGVDYRDRFAVKPAANGLNSFAGI